MAKSTWMQEAERRSHDLLRVFNPLDEDYVVTWDKRDGAKLFRVPAKGEAVLIRYIAEKYIREMYQKMVNSDAANKVLEENKRRRESGMAEMDRTMKTAEQMQFEAPLLNKTPDEQRQIIAQLYVGVENEYGMDRVIEQEQAEKSKGFDDVLSDVQAEKGTSSAVGEPEAPSAPNSEVSEAENTTNGEQNLYRCSYPACSFTTKHKIALSGHQKIHDKKTSK